MLANTLIDLAYDPIMNSLLQRERKKNIVHSSYIAESESEILVFSSYYSLNNESSKNYLQELKNYLYNESYESRFLISKSMTFNSPTSLLFELNRKGCATIPDAMLLYLDIGRFNDFYQKKQMDKNETTRKIYPDLDQYGRTPRKSQNLNPFPDLSKYLDNYNKKKHGGFDQKL